MCLILRQCGCIAEVREWRGVVRQPPGHRLPPHPDRHLSKPDLRVGFPPNLFKVHFPVLGPVWIFGMLRTASWASGWKYPRGKI